MKYVLIACAGVLVVVAIIGAGLFLFLSQGKPIPSEPTTSPFGFTGGTASVASKTLTLSLRDGSTVQARDFTKENQPDWAGVASGYLFAGSDEDAYIILYFPPDAAAGLGEFLVNIQSEPLGEVRRRAEAAMKAKLEMTEPELCKLAVSVRTTPGLSDTYGGYDLGLSFCPGAEPLP